MSEPNEMSPERPGEPEAFANQPSQTAGSGLDNEALAQVIAEVHLKRSHGQKISNEEVMAAHPELMPDLRDELNALDLIHKARVLGDDLAPNQSISRNPIATSAATADENNLHINGYRIEGPILSGGQATVFKGIHERTERKVAIKVMHGGPFAGSRGRIRFEREAKILARLNHPCIIGILDRGRTADGSFFIVMEYVEGRNLDEFVLERPHDVVRTVSLFVKLAYALQDAHQRGVVHRDLKPMNILVDARDEPRILDFGMARLLLENDEQAEVDATTKNLTRTGQILGSLAWASPEQIAGNWDSIDGRSDVYALGVMLFFALTAEFPYPADGSPLELATRIARTKPANVRRLARKHGNYVSGVLGDVVEKALAKPLKERYASALMFGRDLEGFLSGSRRSLRAYLPKSTSVVTFLIVLICIAGVWWVYPKNHVQAQEFTNSIQMEMVAIPKGSISPDGTITDATVAGLSTKRLYQAKAPFFLSKTPVTTEQFRTIAGLNGGGSTSGDLKSPIRGVTWDQADHFCKLLSQREGRHYRLPTSEEWLYVLERGQAAGLTDLNAAAWYAENSGRQVHPVNNKISDCLGLSGMVGNIRQWCSDGPKEARNNPSQTDSNPDLLKFVAGTDYLSSSQDCRSTFPVTAFSANTALPTIGFRVVCDPPGQN